MNAKRIFDVVVSGALLLALSPLLVVLAIAVVLDSGFPFLFSQKRVGRNFRDFRILKFRSMRQGVGGPLITTGGDGRITRAGRFLRASKLDELPQLWNVFRGEMSLVGPRPEVREYVELYRDRYEKVLRLRPGITDPASLCFRDEEQILAASAHPLRMYREEVLPAKLDLAEKYVEERSFSSDVLILLETAGRLFGMVR